MYDVKEIFNAHLKIILIEKGQLLFMSKQFLKQNK